MKKLYYNSLVLPFLLLCLACTENTFQLKSPDRKNIITLELNQDGELLYSITRENSVLVGKSDMGITTTDKEYTFTEKLTFVEVKQNKTEEKYTLPTGKVKEYHNKYNEKVYTFRNESGKHIHIECRAYNDGIAFRYVFEKEGVITVNTEKTTFHFAPDAITWMMDYKDDYEKYYPKRGLSAIEDSILAYPGLFHMNAKWILFTEANVYNHPATRIKKGRGEEGMKVDFPEEDFTISHYYESPWRTFIIGDDLAALVESVLVENLNPPSVTEDMSWIEPGVAVFPWWGNYLANSDINILKEYVNLAAEMNWQWVEFDVSLVGSPFRTSDLWETTPWLKEFTEYAHSKGIKVYGWDEIEILKTKEGRDHVYGKYKELGIEGIKIDYINSDCLYAMQFREEALKDAIDYGLMVSFHGESMPRGQRRKYPNLMTQEAVKGAEYYTFMDLPPTPEHNCTLPFTRNVVGPMDYTPVTFTRREENPRITTYAHELALPVIFESGWVVMADRPEAYLTSPAKEYLQKVRATWDETKFLDGYPGEFVCMARRHGNEWHLAAINAGTERTVKIKLDFLPAGTYTFNIYEDDPVSPIEHIVIREITASAGEELEFLLLPNGGFCGIIQ